MEKEIILVIGLKPIAQQRIMLFGLIFIPVCCCFLPVIGTKPNSLQMRCGGWKNQYSCNILKWL